MVIKYMMYKIVIIILIGIFIILLSRSNSVVRFLRKVFSALFYTVPGNTVMRRVFSKEDGSKGVKIGLVVFGLMFVISGLALLLIEIFS